MVKSTTKKSAAKSKEKKAVVIPPEPNGFLKQMKVRLTFIQELLGSASPHPDIQAKHVSKHAPDAPTLAEEVEASSVEEVIEKTMTVFPRRDGVPINWDYQYKGYMKSCAAYLARMANTHSATLVAYRKVIAGTIFVSPRAIPFVIPEGEEMGNLQRSIRVETMQGPRVALANSETLPIGTTTEFTIHYPKLKAKGVDLEACIREWLNYGVFHGHGQWRNGGFGRFTWEDITDDA